MNLSEGYGVLKCHAIAGKMELGKDTPHYQIHVKDGKFSYRLAVNVRSSQQPFDLLYLVENNFEHYLTDKLNKLEFGFTKIPETDRKAGGIALDYIRSNLFKVTEMKPLPFNLPGENNDLNELIDSYIKRAIETKAVIYVFGEPWGVDKVEDKPDKIFGFEPGRGIHNIHMNQGNSGSFAKENGVYQDGALLIHFPSAIASQDSWVGAFFAFQSQSFHTDDSTGNPIDKKVGTEPPDPNVPAVKARVKIVAALVNPLGDDAGKETVTLINSSPQQIDFNGWSLTNKLKQKQSLDGLQIEPSASATVLLDKQKIQLSNDGGIITILNQEGIKVDGVSYTKEDAKDQGWTIVF
ncbi:DUF2278 family protein [Scytonema hofmannii FACHB-248]|uniref:DUF2278 family protein n=1 Tax=Scytonema hofmannii FACHB-248 TaxID=1842502 RepID=A0ABR8GZV9_9CYAN|nr:MULTISPECIES: DUF2278 family protein [Nostocales]MBD2609105.1 DUF2278 family protein [Scytonema hofmannii FACHB-248]